MQNEINTQMRKTLHSPSHQALQIIKCLTFLSLKTDLRAENGKSNLFVYPNQENSIECRRNQSVGTDRL